MFFVITAWITVVVFVALLGVLTYFGLFVETNHDVFLLTLIYVVAYVGPMFLLSLSFLGLHHFRAMAKLSELESQQAYYMPVQQQTIPQVQMVQKLMV